MKLNTFFEAGFFPIEKMRLENMCARFFSEHRRALFATTTISTTISTISTMGSTRRTTRRRGGVATRSLSRVVLVACLVLVALLFGRTFAAFGEDDDDDDAVRVAKRPSTTTLTTTRRGGGRRLLGNTNDDDEEDDDEDDEEEEEEEEDATTTTTGDGKQREEAPEGCFWTRCSRSATCPSSTSSRRRRSTTTTITSANVLTVREVFECEPSFLGTLVHGRAKKPTEKLCCDERAAATARWERGAKWAEDGNEDACFNRCPKNSRCNAKHGTCECDIGYVARDAPKDEDEDDDAQARVLCYPVREDQTEDLPIGSEDVPEIEDPMLEKERMIEKEKESREKLAAAKKKKIAEAKRLEKMKRNRGKAVFDDKDDEDDSFEDDVDDIVKQPTKEIQKQLRSARLKSRMGSKEREKRKQLRKQKESWTSFYLCFFILTVLAQVFVCARLGMLTNVAMRVFGKNPRKLLRWSDSTGGQLLPTRLTNE
jgi:hypothetical protein